MSTDLSIHNVAKVELCSIVLHSSSTEDDDLRTRDILITREDGETIVVVLFSRSGQEQSLQVSL